MVLFRFVIIISLIVSGMAKLFADIFFAERISLVGSFLGLQLSLNRGIAFGIQLPWNLHQVLIPVALVLLVIVAHRSPRTVPNEVGFGLIIGGALANILDRLPDGAVTDFFQVGTFPIFNVADSFITVGVILLLIESVRLHYVEKAKLA